MSEAYKNNMSIPKDIAIVGYDNLDISKFIYPGITTVACNYKEYSKAIVNAIENVENMSSNTRIAIPTDLIIRGTTRYQS